MKPGAPDREAIRHLMPHTSMPGFTTIPRRCSRRFQDAVLMPARHRPLADREAIQRFSWPADGSSTHTQEYTTTIDDIGAHADADHETEAGPDLEVTFHAWSNDMLGKSLTIGALIAVAGSAVTTPIWAQESVLSRQLETRINAIEPQVIEWRRDIHEHPELGNREFRTARLVAEHLRSLGIDVQTEVAHTGVVGILRGERPGPVVLLRADMDGLPVTERADLPYASKVTTEYNGEQVGVMHACGHDTHVAILMGTATVLAGMRDELPGTVKFMFQPAEEGAPEGEDGGAELMVREGILENPKVDAAFALHIWSKGEVQNIYWTPGGIWASADAYRIVVRGQQTHGGYPWNGVDPIVISAHIITALQTIVSREMQLTDGASVVTVGMIRAGVRSNIIPEQVEMVGTIRALDPEHRAQIHRRVRELATGIAESMGGSAEVTVPVGMGYPVTYNDDALTAEMIPVLEAMAPGRVRRTPAETGAEDFSFVSSKVPGLYIQLGGRPVNVPKEQAADHHTPDFFIDDSGLKLGVRAMTAMALHYMRTHQ